MSNENGFIQLIRDKEVMELIKVNDAFILLTVIAYRAKRTLGFNVRGFKQREALIGDYKNYGMTEQRYRTSKSKLEKWGFATFKATNKGTVATLCNKRIYDINLETTNEQVNSPVTSKQRTGNEQVTTNKNVKNENNGNNDNIYTIEQVNNEFFKQGLTDADAEKFFNHYKSQGWLKGNGLPVLDLAAQVTNWRLNPKQYEVKEDDKQADIRKAMQYVTDRDNREGKGIMAEINPSGTIAPDENLF